jgi:16S rRNA (guanine966-N2)-methyltransferase
MPERDQGRLRIIAGKWRSRKLAFPDQVDLRPTPDRVRETLFNWLQTGMAGRRCLDLFAGSGALGFEAASRGAAEVVMVENSPGAASALARNIELLEAGGIELVNMDACDWLANNDRRVFDIVFLDPPFSTGLLGRCCQLLENGQALAEDAKIYIEHAVGDNAFVVPDAWRCLKSKTAGQVAYKLFERAR